MELTSISVIPVVSCLEIVVKSENLSQYVSSLFDLFKGEIIFLKIYKLKWYIYWYQPFPSKRLQKAHGHWESTRNCYTRSRAARKASAAADVSTALWLLISPTQLHLEFLEGRDRVFRFFLSFMMPSAGLDTYPDTQDETSSLLQWPKPSKQVQNTGSASAGRGAEQLELSCLLTVWRFPIHLNIYLPYGPTPPLIGIHSKKNSNRYPYYWNISVYESCIQKSSKT